MPDIHVSRGDRPKSLLTIALEVLLIATGVFLGLMGEQWRQSREHREAAELALRRFRTEIQANRKAVDAVKDYHVKTRKDINVYLDATPAARRELEVHLQGLQPVFFEHTAWDLALATQSLSYIEPALAFSLSRAYTGQQTYSELSRGILQAMYIRSPSEDRTAFLGAVSTYYGDVVLMEPALLKQYDELLPQIDRSLGEPAAATSSGR